MFCLKAVSNLDEESHWTVHYKATWHQQENVFLPSSRSPCVEDLHRQAKVNLKTVLRDCDKLRKDGLRSSRYYSQAPLFASTSSHHSGSSLDEEEDQIQAPTVAPADEEMLFHSRRPKTPVPPDPSEIDVQTNWTKALPLPTPEEKMRQQAQAIQTDVVPINVTGESFDRQAGNRRSLVHSNTPLRRPTKIKRRKTITGLPESVQKELGSGQSLARGSSTILQGHFSTMSRLESSRSSKARSSTRDSSCQTEEIKVVPPSVRRIRAQKGQGIAAQLAGTSGCVSPVLGATGSPPARDQLRFHSLPRQGAKVSLLDGRGAGAGGRTECPQPSRARGPEAKIRPCLLPRPKSQEVGGGQKTSKEAMEQSSPASSPHVMLSPRAELSSTAPDPSGEILGEPREDHCSSSGNWSASSGEDGVGSARQSPTSDTTPALSRSDSAVCLASTLRPSGQTPEGRSLSMPPPPPADRSGLGPDEPPPLSKRWQGQGDRSLSRSISLRKTKKPPLPPARTDSLRRKPKGSSPVLSQSLIASLQRSLEGGLSRQDSPAASPGPPSTGAPDPWLMRPRSQSSSNSSTCGSHQYSTGAATPSQSETSSLRSECGDPWAYYSQGGGGLEVDAWHGGAYDSSAHPKLKSLSPEKSLGVTSPSSGYSSQCNTPTGAGPPHQALPRPAKTKPKVPERKSSLRSSLSTSSSSASLSSSTSDSRPQVGATSLSVPEFQLPLPTSPPLSVVPLPPPPTYLLPPSNLPLPTSSSRNLPLPKTPSRNFSMATSPTLATSSSRSLPLPTSPSPDLLVPKSLSQNLPVPTSPAPDLPESISPPPNLPVPISPPLNLPLPTSPPPDLLVPISPSRNFSLPNSPSCNLPLPTSRPSDLAVRTSRPSDLPLPMSLFPPPPLFVTPPPLPSSPPPAPPLPKPPQLPLPLPPLPRLDLKVPRGGKKPPPSPAPSRGGPEAPGQQGDVRDSPACLPLITADALRTVKLRSMRRGGQSEPPRVGKPQHKPAVPQRPSSFHSPTKHPHNTSMPVAKAMDAPSTDLPSPESSTGTAKNPELSTLSNTAKSELGPKLELLPCGSGPTDQGTGANTRIHLEQHPAGVLTPKRSKLPVRMPPPIARKPKLSLLVPPSPWDLAAHEKRPPDTLKSAAEPADGVGGEQPPGQDTEEVNSGPAEKLESTLRPQGWGADQSDADRASEGGQRNPRRQEQAVNVSPTWDQLDGDSFTSCQENEIDDVFEDSFVGQASGCEDGSEQPSTPSRPRTTEDLFAAIHRSKRRVLGRKDSEDEFSRTQTPSSPVTPTGVLPSPGSLRQAGSIQRTLRKSSTSSDSFKALLLRKGSRPEQGCRMSAAEMLRSSNPRQYPPEPERPVGRPAGQRGRNPREEWASHEGPMPRGAGLMGPGIRYGRSRTPPLAASSRYSARLHLHRLHSSPMTVIREAEAWEASESLWPEEETRRHGESGVNDQGTEPAPKTGDATPREDFQPLTSLSGLVAQGTNKPTAEDVWQHSPADISCQGEEQALKGDPPTSQSRALGQGTTGNANRDWVS
ncbi:NHS-like protein 1 isoform X2 [Narcine bancroftii]|uniref:NHS-like protein 1 isoform X2 n=1 Tax=Narcine bancroftii TaxID=1343680 RepID=UPI0038323251